MKKTIILFTVMLCATAGFSQINEGYSTKPGRSTTFVKNSFWDNWFLGVGMGANVYFGDKDAQADFWDRPTLTPNLQVGTWFNPYLGGRIKLSGGFNIHTFNDNAAYMSRNRYVSAEANFLWNVTNYLLPYRADRVYNFIPYAGVGWAYGWNYHNFPPDIKTSNHVNSVTIDAGIINRFNFSERVALDIEISGKLLKDQFDQRSGGNFSYDCLATVSANLVFNLGKTVTFSEAVLQDPAEIERLNRTINEQRAEINALANRPVEREVVVQEVVRTVDTGLEPINNVVIFPINVSKIPSNQEVNVYNIAKYMKDNPEIKVRVVGYTDRVTGTPAINERLSRERAENVGHMLINKYNIDRSRVQVDWVGQTDPPFNVPEWDRAAIMYIED